MWLRTFFTLPNLIQEEDKLKRKCGENKMINRNKHNNSLSIKNVKVDYLFCSVSNFSLNSSVWVLYLGFKGMSLGQVGLLEGIFHVTSFLFEVPTGAMADLLGRKRVLLLGRLLSVVSTLMMLFSNSFPMFALSFILSAASYNLNSGSEEALVYDSMKEAGREEEYLTVNGRLNFLIEVSQGTGTFVGGILSDISYTVTYLCQMLKDVFAFFAGTLFEEPEYHEKEATISIKKHFYVCYDVLKSNAAVRRILFYYPIVFSFHALTFFYGQQHLSDMGMSKTQIALIMLIAGIVSSFSALLSSFFARVLGARVKYVAAVIVAFSIFSFGFENSISAVLCFIALNFANSLLYPIASGALNERIPSEQRATIISVDSMLFSMAMVVIFPVSGFLGDSIGLDKVFHVLGLLLLFYVTLFARSEKEA